MLEQPETRYAASHGLNIGYQVVGEGPLDVVFVPGLLSQIDLLWTLPAAVRFFSRLASFARAYDCAFSTASAARAASSRANRKSSS